MKSLSENLIAITTWEDNIDSKKSGSNDKEQYLKTHHSLSALCQRPNQKDSKDM